MDVFLNLYLKESDKSEVPLGQPEMFYMSTFTYKLVVYLGNEQH